MAPCLDPLVPECQVGFHARELMQQAAGGHLDHLQRMEPVLCGSLLLQGGVVGCGGRRVCSRSLGGRRKRAEGLSMRMGVGVGRLFGLGVVLHFLKAPCSMHACLSCLT